MGLLDGFLQQIQTGDTVKDWKHASKLFVGDNFRLAPKMGFLYHVFFDLDPAIPLTKNKEQTEAGMLVKNVDLPKFTIDTKTLNSYNKPNIVQNKIKNESVNISFHDDSANVVQSLWADYYTYYYRDMDAGIDASGHVMPPYSQNTKYGARKNIYGYTPRSSSGEETEQFIRAIRIYSLHQRKFTEYILVNPTITSFKHGQHTAGSSDPVQCDMTVAYEFVLYCEGNVSSTTVTGFADLHYDKSKSPLTPVNGTQSIMGPGGLVGTASSVINSIPNDPVGAIFKAGRGLKNANSMNIKGAILGELAQFGMDILRGGNPLNNISIPVLGDNASKIGTVQAPNSASSDSAQNGASSNGENIGLTSGLASLGTSLQSGFTNITDVAGKIFNPAAPVPNVSQVATNTNPAPPGESA